MSDNDSQQTTDEQTSNDMRAGGTKARTAETPEEDPREDSAPARDGSSDVTDEQEMGREEYVEETQEYEPAPEGFEAEWDVEDTQVPDKAVVVEVEGRGHASARLVPWGIVEDMQDEGGEFGAEQVAKILRDHYESPSFTGLDAEGVRSMKMAEPDRHLDAIMPGMNTEMNADGSAQVDSGNQ